MRWTKVLGVALLAIGLLVMVLRTYGYTRETESADLGEIEIQVERREQLPVPIWLGLGLAAAGGALLLLPRRPEP